MLNFLELITLKLNYNIQSGRYKKNRMNGVNRTKRVTSSGHLVLVDGVGVQQAARAFHVHVVHGQRRPARRIRSPRHTHAGLSIKVMNIVTASLCK